MPLSSVLAMTNGEPHLVVAGVPFVVTPEGALHEPSQGVLVVADLHLEKGSAGAVRGLFLPPYDTGATLARLGRVIGRLAPRTVICLGDSFHDRGGPARLLDADRAALAALQRGRDWIWIAGNHDPEAPAGLAGDAVDTLALGPLMFRHEPTPGPATGEIAGHLHPVAVVRGTGAAVRRRCVAADGERAVLPAFGAYAGGLPLGDAAFRGLFDRRRLVAFVLGDAGVFPVPGHRCLGAGRR